ncbi:MAG: tRNA (adenosine(37)-N6)-threonylcarbamoyltransferase complex dimerization subunit type 1 TsaB [Bacteroidales bacterium]|nr:tRNA (adenosine(37)-N6)-threonylcarbamoyltransferase complex dimerization subunit type 1 TsaB [Bacteroidales bacterium]
MARILLIETSTAVLSVALSENGTVVASRECREPRLQASLTAPLVKEVLDAKGLTVSDCDAICVGKGPGSYTGLRVGVSTAKGLAFGAGLPLIAIGSLDILAQAAIDGSHTIIPMIDARRMEVYTAVFSPSGDQLTPVEAKIIGPDSFKEQLEAGPVVFIGDGALKCKDVITHPNASFVEAWPLAANMARLAQKAFDQNRFDDLAYFEPFYLKDFVATVSRKSILPQKGTN